MKIEVKGTLHAKLSRQYTNKNGENVIVASVVILEGNMNGYDIFKNFQTTDANLIQEIKNIPDNSKVFASGYLNCSFYEKDSKKQEFTKINLKEIRLQEQNTQQSQPQKQTQNTNTQYNNTDLPF